MDAKEREEHRATFLEWWQTECANLWTESKQGFAAKGYLAGVESQASRIENLRTIMDVKNAELSDLSDLRKIGEAKIAALEARLVEGREHVSVLLSALKYSVPREKIADVYDRAMTWLAQYTVQPVSEGK